MVKPNFLSWDTTANNNTDVGGVNINEGCPPSNVNNGMREMMAQLRSGVDPVLAYSAKAANYTAVGADANTFFRFTAAATLALTAAATLGANWHCTVWADGGDVTIDPDASETVNGVTTVVVPNGNMVSLVCTGSTFFAVGIPSLWNLISADAGAALGPILTLYRNSASPAASDAIGGIRFDGEDSAGNQQTYASIEGSITDPTTTSEDGALFLRAVVAGTLATIISMNGAAVTVNGTLTVTG
ncbi:hypothetical protein [Rhizobium johnstonii]|uniref:hypothetical protein n=1 Tax=Rhizobium johnstonii TaxID=3019933 RepID=UPI003F99DBD7